MSDKLAILGGEPVRTESFPSWPVWDEREQDALLSVLESGIWGIAPDGGKISEFERAFAEAHDAAYGQAVFNGSVALEVALRALDIDYGDEVIVPAYTFLATATSCLEAGAIPVFVDIDPDTYNIDPAAVEAAITPRTRVIVPVHIGGLPANLDAIIEIARQHDLAVLEDACQAHGAAWKERRVGAIGDLGCFSFQSSKNVNAGEGGMIVTDDEELAERCWSIHNCGRIRKGAWYQHEILGGNYRMTQWQAAVLLAQLTRLEALAERREQNGRYLAERLAQETALRPLARDPRVTRHGYHLFISRYDPEAFAGLPRRRFLEALYAEGIPCSEGYVPLYRMPAIQAGVRRLGKAVGWPGAFPDTLPECPVTERACAEEGVWFSQSMLLGSESDMNDIVTAVKKVQRAADALT
ncbi:MAG: DegT/DnrJ/EryC1/StrS family aminotransferase [Anaerolineae bacterium]